MNILSIMLSIFSDTFKTVTNIKYQLSKYCRNLHRYKRSIVSLIHL